MDAAASHIWQSTVVAAGAVALVWMVRRNRASVRHAIWLAASIKFLVPFALLTAAADALSWTREVLPGYGATAIGVMFTTRVLPAVSETWWRWMLAVWLAGTFVVLVRWSLEWRRLRVLVRDATPVVEGLLYDSVGRVERAAGIRTPTAIVQADADIEPAVVGFWRPVLVWPRLLSDGLSADHLEAIVAHEIAHVARRDNLLASVHMVVSAVFWFHPLVWWIGTRLADERERACDQRVLAFGHRPAVYAAGILKTCERCLTVRLANVAGISGGDLKTRIARIMCDEPHARVGVAKAAVLAGALLAVLAVPVLGGDSASARGAAAQNDDASKPERVGPDIKPPRLRKEVKPQYSTRAMAEKIEGEVVMDCVIKADGTVGDITIVKSLDPDLDQAAIDAARLWEFEPGTKNGKPVAVLVTITIAFTLK